MTREITKLTTLSFLEALTRAPFAIVLTDPNRADNPIVYVNDTFAVITGYAEDFAIGRNCRFLQGQDTDQPALDKLRSALKEEREEIVDLRNYRPDGQMFLNRLMISPLRSEEGTLMYYLGVQMEVEAHPGDEKTKQDEDLETALVEIQHRVKNHLAMIVSMIRLQGKSQTGPVNGEFETLSRRIETLQLLYEELSDRSGSAKDGSENEYVPLGAYLSRVATAIAHIDGRPGIRVNIDADQITVRFQDATQLGLVLSEIMANALQHAFDGRDEGLLMIEAKLLTNGTFRLVVSDDGVGLPEELTWPAGGNLGGKIISRLIDNLNATLDVSSRAIQGTTIIVDVPSLNVTGPDLLPA